MNVAVDSDELATGPATSRWDRFLRRVESALEWLAAHPAHTLEAGEFADLPPVLKREERRDWDPDR